MGLFLHNHVREQVLLQKPGNIEDDMQLAEIYDPLVFVLSDKRHYKKPGTDFPRAAHTSGDAMEVEALTQEEIPKLTSLLK